MPEINDILKNNPDAVVPDYVKKAMMEESSGNKYGSTVFDYVPPKDESVQENDFFKDKEYSKEETEKEREELKQILDNSSREIKEVTATDALSGIRSSVPDSSYREAYNEINKSVDASNIKGRTITLYGKQLLKSLIGEDPNEEELKLMASKFEEHSDAISTHSEEEKTGFYNMSKDMLRSFCSDRILDSFDAICPENSDEYCSVLARLLEQIYIAYDNILGYRDDIKELNELALQIDESGMLNIGGENTELNIGDPKSLDHISQKLEKYMELMKNLDERNKKMKQDYKIDDIETYLFEDVKQCLDSALSFEKVIQKVNTAGSKFSKDLKNRKDTDSSIENWIHDIKHDPKTLYTFPCNDFLSDSESREELVRFFLNSYLVQIVQNNNLDVPSDIEIIDYLIDNGYANSDSIDNMKTMAYTMLYVLSRSFKYNRVKENNSDIRILSYTLDIISKLGVKSHRERFIHASEYVMDKVFPNIVLTSIL